MDMALAAILFMMILLMLMMTSCKHEPDVLPTQIMNNNTGNNSNNNNNNTGESTCDPDSVYFQTQVLPLLISNCSKDGCHNSTSHKEGIVLDNYTNVMATGNIIPGRADQSEIYDVLIKSNSDDRMPPQPASGLSNSQINLIFNWIEQGALNNTCLNTCDTTNITFSGTIFPLMQNSCIGCHSGVNPSGSINLTTYENVSVVVQNGKLLGSVENKPGFQPMPRGGNKLMDCQVDQIRIWIQNGALNN